MDVKYFWWGFRVRASHAEACAWTDPNAIKSVAQLAALLATKIGGLAGAIIAVVAAVWFAAMNYIRSLNQNSGGKGVALEFLWIGPTYIGVKRRQGGRGSSPCP